jgi:hypothetical protein
MYNEETLTDKVIGGLAIVSFIVLVLIIGGLA